MKQSISDSLLINNFHKFIWCTTDKYGHYIKQDYIIYTFIKELLDYRFNDLVIKRSNQATFILIYLNPPFNQKLNVSNNSLNVILSSLFYNLINIRLIEVATLKKNNNEIKQFIVYQYDKLVNFISSYVAFLLETNNTWFFIKNKLILLLKNPKVFGYFIIISGLFPDSNMAQKKTIKWGKVSRARISNNVYYKLQTVELPAGSYSIKVLIHLIQ